MLKIEGFDGGEKRFFSRQNKGSDIGSIMNGQQLIGGDIGLFLYFSVIPNDDQAVYFSFLPKPKCKGVIILLW